MCSRQLSVGGQGGVTGVRRFGGAERTAQDSILGHLAGGGLGSPRGWGFCAPRGWTPAACSPRGRHGAAVWDRDPENRTGRPPTPPRRSLGPPELV